jgi:hypothetical protein
MHPAESDMTQFNDREKAFESKFAHDSEMQFKAQSRGNKLLGLWAAAQMGLDGADAEAYAKEVVKADLAEAGTEDVFRKVRGDFDARSVGVGDEVIRAKMAEAYAQAKEQLLKTSS